MMFIDASALVAILLEEKDHPVFAAALEKSVPKQITPFVLMEAGLATMRVKKRSADTVAADMAAICDHFQIETTELTSPMIVTALQAYERYGKGRGHPAQLNMGDCLSYAAARTLGLPLLYKGEDFRKTDARSAL